MRPRFIRGNGGKKLTLRNLFDQWAQHPEQKQQAPRTVSRYRGVFDAVSIFLDNPDARAVTTADIRRYVEARMADETKPLSPHAARDVHKAAMSSIFTWARGKGVVIDNPATDITIKVTHAPQLRSKAATDQEARMVADAALAVSPEVAIARTLEAAIRWCPFLCLYTGCRIGEVTQLRREDVTLIDGVHILNIMPEAGTVKAGGSRYVPIHSRLIELGFIAFVEASPRGPLFFDPDTRRHQDAVTPQSQLMAGKVNRWARTHGLSDGRLTKPLHALRHRFMTCARRAGIEEQYAEQIAGHGPKGMNRRYGEFTPEVLHREVSKLEPSLVEGR